MNNYKLGSGELIYQGQDGTRVRVQVLEASLDLKDILEFVPGMFPTRKAQDATINAKVNLSVFPAIEYVTRPVEVTTGDTWDDVARTEQICDQLTRYNGRVFNSELLAILEEIVELNDDLWHSRAPNLIRQRIGTLKSKVEALEKTQC